MKLYHAPNTCSLSPYIVMNELTLSFGVIWVDNRTKLTSDGRDFRDINPKGYVAALELDDGRVLTEGPAILQYLADLQPEKKLAPPCGTWERVRLQEWLNFISSEIHAGLAPLFSSELDEAAKAYFRERVFKRFDYLDSTLSERMYVQGDGFSVADAYLFTVLGWCRFFSIDLGAWPALEQYVLTVEKRPSVRRALEAEASHTGA